MTPRPFKGGSAWTRRRGSIGPADGGASSRPVVRLLGRLLGDVIREQQGQATFDRIEDIRARSVGEHRRGQRDAALGETLMGLSVADMLLLIRGFSIFSQLANIADDHLLRREALNEPSPLERLTLDPTPPAARRFLNEAVITPVITAHPTEVRRKSILDRETAIAALLDASGDGAAQASEIETALKREVRTLWQTRCCGRCGSMSATRSTTPSRSSSSPSCRKSRR